MANVLKPSVSLRPFVRFLYARGAGHYQRLAFVQPVPARTAQVIDFSLANRCTMTFPGSP
jgi:hypothetical protein